ncbi:hypothetical protein [Nannocystis radixulma]|uniref:HEPN domain-containing protein n=1 Tax=Nannocystis radixulma TaxID=2995305 RepID=A0ABT5B8T9_9BACT|nr:hypothetical protein [Nannocystis radixulma]MDC0670546.1 hypothetical protein [Nannocystis radixulma]
MAGDDYYQTAIAMHEAGAMLVQEQPRAACYLLGYVCECVLKEAAFAALKAQGKSEQEAIDSLRQVSHDLTRLITLHATLALSPSARLGRGVSLHRLAPRMSALLPGPLPSAKKVQHWHPEHRYDGHRWDAQAALDYADEARALLKTLIGLKLDGAL